MVVILFMMALLITLGVGILSMTSVNMMVAGNKRCERAAFHAAESGIEQGIYTVYNVFDNLGVFDKDMLGIVMDADKNNVADNLNGFNVTMDIVQAKDENGNILKPFFYQTMMQGAPAYHTAYEYEVVATAQTASTGGGTCRGGSYQKTIKERFRVVETPLVQYYIFNNVGRQEIAPGGQMHMWGRVHANFDICFAPNQTWVYFHNYSWNYLADSANEEWAPNIVTAHGNFNVGCCPGRPWGASACGDPGNGVTYVKIIERPSGWPPNPPASFDGTLPGTTPNTNECATAGSCLWLPQGNPVATATINALASNGKVRAGVPSASPPSTQALKRNTPGATPGTTGYGFYEYVARYPLRDVDGIAIVGTGSMNASGTGGIKVYASHRDPQNSSFDFDNRDVTSLLDSNGRSLVKSAPPLVLSDSDIYLSPYSASREIIWESNNAFYNARSGRAVNLTEVNLGRLQRWWCNYLDFEKNGTQTGACETATGQSKLYATGGMLIFISRSKVPPAAHQLGTSTDPLEAVRLNSEMRDELWVKATAASDNPIYIIGENGPGGAGSSGFNAVDSRWVGFAAVADSVTLLSKAFTHPNSGSGLNNAVTSSFNVAIFGGEYPDTTANDNRTGGVENFARLLENWTGIDLTITGCFIALWKDDQDNAPWYYGSPVYTLPGRNFGWEPQFGNPDYWPPYVPSIFNVERVSWFEGGQ